MSRKCEEIEQKIRPLLPVRIGESPKGDVEPLVREWIKSGDEVISYDTGIFTHSVCHLFEKFGNQKSPSFLHTPKLLPLAEELVNYTLQKALDANDFSCVSRIIRPIVDFNVAQLDNPEYNEIFKPEILSNPAFIQAYEQSGEAKYAEDSIAFCKGASVDELYTKGVERKVAYSKITQSQIQTQVTPGVFIDVEGTLLEPLEYARGASKEKILNNTTLEYALQKLAQGTQVTIFTGGDHESAQEDLRQKNIDERLHIVEPKKNYLGQNLEVCVDDTPPALQGFRAQTHYLSGAQALKAEYAGINDETI